MIALWRITTRCQLACPFCACDSTLDRNPVEVAPEKVLRFAEVLAGVPGGPHTLSLLGGEPFLWGALERVARGAHALGLDLSTTTSGVSLGSEHTLALLAGCFRDLTLSVDGFADFHDPLRRFPGGFEKIRRAVEDLSTRAPRLRLRANTVLMGENVAAYPALCRTLARWGFHELTFNQLGGRERPEFHPSHRLTPADVRFLQQALPELRRELAASGVRLCGSDAYLARLRASADGTELPQECPSMGGNFLFIDERGLVAPCAFTTEALGIPVDRIRSPRQILELPERFARAKFTRRISPEFSACHDCPSTQLWGKFQDVPPPARTETQRPIPEGRLPSA